MSLKNPQHQLVITTFGAKHKCYHIPLNAKQWNYTLRHRLSLSLDYTSSCSESPYPITFSRLTASALKHHFQLFNQRRRRPVAVHYITYASLVRHRRPTVALHTPILSRARPSNASVIQRTSSFCRVEVASPVSATNLGLHTIDHLASINHHFISSAPLPNQYALLNNALVVALQHPDSMYIRRTLLFGT
jgi:hypothetical protein